MQIVDVSSHAFASLKSKASKLPKIRREKKGNGEPETEIHEPIHSETIEPVVEERAPTLQPFDIPRPTHAPKTQTASVPAGGVPVPTLQPLGNLQPGQGQAVQAAAVTTPGPAATLQPFDIPRPVHAKKGLGVSPTKKDKAAKPIVPVPALAATEAQPEHLTTQANEPAHVVNQIQHLAVTTCPYPPLTSNPLFPPAPTYAPPTPKNRIIWALRQLLSHFLSGIGIFFILIAYAFHGLKKRLLRLFSIHTLTARPFQEEENRRAELRKIDSLSWIKRETQKKSAFPEIAAAADVEATADLGVKDGFVPTEGGPDRYLVDVGYYARRVGLDSEEIKVQTEDGFVLDLWHIYDPREYTPLSRAQRMIRGPESIDDIRPPSRAPVGSEKAKDKGREGSEKKQKYPVLMLHGLMQSSGVYCTNDDHSLAFWLCKQGFDVWLGNNRCGLNPEHVQLKKGDPNLWAWNVQHMATLDLPALTARVLSETSSPKLGLVAHSQGTTQSLIALSKQQRPSLSAKISVLCALAPAAYSGPLLDRFDFKFLRRVPTSVLRAILGVKYFLPIISLIGALQGKIPQRWVGRASYHLSDYLFSWSDLHWDRGLRDRHSLFAPTSISVEAMKWWFSRDGFAHHGSILSSHDQVQREVEEDLLQDYFRNLPGKIEEDFATELLEKHVREPRAPESWFADGVGDHEGGRVPPMAFWIAENDTFCDGRELMNRFERGREPGVRVLDGGRNFVKGYGHLDVLWACDVIEKVGWGVRDALWRTVGAGEETEARVRWRVPAGMEGVEVWVDDRVDGTGYGKEEDSEREKELERVE